MPRILTKSNEHFRRAVKRLPLGVASNFRYWGEDRTIYVKYGRGARIVDLDDNVYIDYRMGYGPAILGYADPRVDAAAREGMEIGGVFALATERELKVAERISQMVPAAELVRFSNSGTEAVMAGLRLARAYTGKDDYVILEGGYHGLFDAATVGFGARNFTDLARGLKEMARVVRPGGRVVVLEITTPTKAPLSLFYGLWFDRVVPALGRLAALIMRSVQWSRKTPSGGAFADAYTYLPNSVKRFPAPPVLAAEMERAGLQDVGYLLTAGGIIAIHSGTVPQERA